jgi:hypothetical protein
MKTESKHIRQDDFSRAGLRPFGALRAAHARRRAVTARRST